MIILWCGKYMSGKTVGACTFPKPMLYLDCDGNFTSVLTTRDVKGNLVVPDTNQITRVSLIRTSVSNMNFQTVQTGSIPPAHCGR